jgi:hypothetical protein
MTGRAASILDALLDFGIRHGVRTGTFSVWQDTTCPQCSHKRQAQHRNAKCLGVIINRDPERVTTNCKNCGWSETRFVDGNGRDAGKTFHVYHDTDGAVLFRKVRNPPGVEPKCYWERPDGKGGWVKGLKGITNERRTPSTGSLKCRKPSPTGIPLPASRASPTLTPCGRSASPPPAARTAQRRPATKTATPFNTSRSG